MDGLPAYVNGSRQPGEPYILQTNVLAVVWESWTAHCVNSASIGIGRGEEKGREVGTTTVRMIPGAVTELVFYSLAGWRGVVASELELTPRVSPWVTILEPSLCTRPSGRPKAPGGRVLGLHRPGSKRNRLPRCDVDHVHL